MMARRRLSGVATLLAVLVLGSGLTLAAVPRSATLATHAVGTGFNAMGTGIAAVVSRQAPMAVRVQPFAGPPAWLPSMEWRPDRMVSEKAFILYQPGAVKFFKEKGVWSKEMEALQATLLSQ